MVNGLLAILEYLTTSFTRIAPFFPVDMFFVFVQYNVADESFPALITRFPDAHMYCLNVLLQCKPHFPYTTYKLLAAILAHQFALSTVAMDLLHVQLEAVGSVVFTVSELFGICTMRTGDRLWVGVFMKLLHVLAQVVLALFVFSAYSTHCDLLLSLDSLVGYSMNTS